MSLLIFRIQRLAQILWPVAAIQPGSASPGAQQHGSGPPLAAAVRHAEQHRCVAGWPGRALRPRWPCGAPVCLPNCHTVPEDPTG